MMQTDTRVDAADSTSVQRLRLPAAIEVARPSFRSLPPFPIPIVAVLVPLASFALLPVWAAGWRLWSSDPLRSIGALFPLLSLLGVLAAWRRLGWETRGSAWGLPLLLFGVASASLFSAPMLLVFFFGTRVRLLHPGMALFAYGAGCALWFGGVPLLRRALAPLALLLLIDPVPHVFNRLLDLPLQTLSAHTARAFAHAVGLQPTGQQLQMMFTPTFGMFIVPGCNGVRGAITLGYLALIFGYVRHLPWRVLTWFTLAAVLAGYLLNLLRLCVLVLYYRAGVGWPSIRPYGTQVDYAIGVTVFLLATLGVGVLIGLYQHRHSPAEEAAVPLAARRSVRARALVLANVALVFFIPQARSVAGSFRAPLTAEAALRALPKTVGNYALTRTWEERDATGSLMFVFGDYVRAIDAAHPVATHLAFGVYLASEDHYVFLSRLTQGVAPDYQGSMQAATRNGQPATLVTSLYRTPNLLTMDAETSCREEFCSANLAAGGATGTTTGLLHPRIADLFVAPAGRRVPILLRRRWQAGTSLPEPVLRGQFTNSVQEFLSALNLQPLLARAQ